MKLHPEGRRYVVKRDKIEMYGAIHVPDQSQEGSLIGTVLVKGPDCTLADIGDFILFARYSGFELPLSGEYNNCLIMNEEDILCKVTGYTKGDKL